MLYTNAKNKKWLADFNARSEQIQKAVAAQKARDAEEGAQRGARSPFHVAPVQVQQERAPSTDMFKQAVRAERPAEQKPVTEQLDYAAQVAAYEAQLKAQEDAQKAQEAQKLAQQEALAKQQAEAAARQKQQQQQQKKQKQKTALKTSQSATTGGSTSGGYGTTTKTTFQPK